jgi:hypothetical protein
MLHGWHGHNGVSLGNPRIGFVCTGQTVEGQPGLEGYYFDYGREIAENERVRFVNDEHAPPFDPAAAPKLDNASWPEERLKKVERAYAMEYVRSLVPTMQSLFGAAETQALLGRTARLIGMQFYDDTAALVGTGGGTALAFAHYLAAMAAAQGEFAEIAEDGAGCVVWQRGWRLMDGLETPSEAFQAWNELWVGALSVHNRGLALTAARDHDGIVWRIVPRAATLEGP